MNKPSKTARVRAGAQRLSKEIGGWALRIDLTRLNMRSTKDDVLGQLFGDYAYGLNVLGLTLEDAQMLGFVTWIDDIDLDTATGEIRDDYPGLQSRWTRAILRLQAVQHAEERWFTEGQWAAMAEAQRS
jgi:hypothetical protein